MAPTTTKATAKRKAPAFKPPRPQATKTSKTTFTPKNHRSLASSDEGLDGSISEEAENDGDDGGDSDDDDMIEPSRAFQGSDDASEAQEPTNTQDAPPSIPPALLTRLLHHHFQDSQTRIGMEARGVVGKYMETFVREAIARAAFERQSGERSTRGVVGDDFLEVEDLEKLAPQLLLDF